MNLDHLPPLPTEEQMKQELEDAVREAERFLGPMPDKDELDRLLGPMPTAEELDKLFGPMPTIEEIEKAIAALREIEPLLPSLEILDEELNATFPGWEFLTGGNLAAQQSTLEIENGFRIRTLYKKSRRLKNPRK